MAETGIIESLPKQADQQGWPWTVETDPSIYKERKSWPKFTIIIPSYNQGTYIEETIRSILLQNYPNLELIIIDGASTDDTLDVIKHYKSWINYFVSEPDRGQSEAINKGINMVSGQLVNWINSDDSLTERALFEVADFFENNPSLSLIYGNCNIVYPGIRTDLYESVAFDPLDFVSRISIHQPSTFWKAELFKEVGLIDESLHYCMDYDLWARIVFDHKSSRLNKTLANFRRYPESKSSNFEDQTNVYNDYRTVVCRVFTSIAEEYIDELKSLGIFHNEEMVQYNITNSFSAELKKAMVDKYIMTCTIQEYNLQNRNQANRLLRRCFNKHHFKEALIYLIKNNFGYRKLFHPYRKAEY